MKKLYSAVLTSLVLTFASVHGTTQEAAAPSVQLSETYTNSEKNYSISYPSTWKKTDVPRLDLVLFAPPKSENANAHASMNIVSENVGQGVTLEQFYSESVSNLTTALKEVQVEKTGTADLNGVASKWIQYTHVMQDIRFQVLQYFMVANDNVFLLTFSSVAESFDSYRPEFDGIAKSFKLTK